MKSLMKAGTLFLFAMTLVLAEAATAAPNRAAPKTDFNALIGDAEVQARRAHTDNLKATAESETMVFYDNNWLRLRQRKRRAIAEADVQLRLKAEGELKTRSQAADRRVAQAR